MAFEFRTSAGMVRLVRTEVGTLAIRFGGKPKRRRQSPAVRVPDTPVPQHQAEPPRRYKVRKPVLQHDVVDWTDDW